MDTVSNTTRLSTLNLDLFTVPFFSFNDAKSSKCNPKFQLTGTNERESYAITLHTRSRRYMSMRHTQPPRPLVYLDTVRNSPYVDGHILRWLTFSFILRCYTNTLFFVVLELCPFLFVPKAKIFYQVKKNHLINILQSDYFHDSLVAETAENVESN